MATNEDRIDVLLVEDSPSDAQLLCELLQGYSPQRFAIERAERLEEAIGLVAERAFDVVLLDLTLPDSTGLDTCTRMRRAAPHVPLVVLTGVDDETIALEAMRQGVEDYLVKGQIIHGSTIGRTTRYAVERSRSERALRESEERYRTLFRTMSEGFALHEILCDGEGRPYDYRFLDVNRAFERQTGLKAADLIGRTIREVLPGIEPIWIERYGRVALTGRPEQFEACSSSLGRWYDVRAYQTVPGRFAAVFTDITERRQVEAVQSFLAQSAGASGHEDFFQALARYLGQTLAADFVCIDRLVEDGLSAQTVAVYYDGKFDDNLTYTLKDTPCGNVVGRTVCCFPRDVRGLFPRDAVLQEMKAEGYVGITLWGHHGEPIGLIALIWRCPLEDPSSAKSLLQLVAVRTAGELERKQAEEALRESEDRLKRSEAIAHLGSWELDLVHNRLTWSDEVYRIFGLEPQEFGATYETFLARVHPDDRAAVDAAYAASVRENRDTYEIEHRVVRQSNGETRIVHEKCEHFRDASGCIVRSVGMVHDITERKRTEEQLLKLNRILAALSNSGKALMRATEESAYLQEVCKIVVEDCGYAMVWIGYAEQDEAKSVRPVAHAGFEEGYLETLQITWADAERGRGPTGTAIRTGQPCLCRNMLTDPNFAPWRQQALQRGYVSSCVLPLLSGGKAFGAVTIYSRQPDPFSPDEVELLKELASDLAYGITYLRLRAAHAQMEAELRRLNDQLEEEVQAQTQELKDTVDRLREEVARRVLAEGALRKRSQMLEAFFRHTITPLAFMDQDFNFVRVNAAYARADHKDPEHFVGKNHFSLYPHEENRAIFAHVVWTKQPYFAQAKPFTYPDAPHRVTYWDWQLTPLLDDRGDVQFLVLNLEDVTERQTAFQELEHRARQLQQLTLELSQAEDRERKRLAEILHDDLQQQLAAAKFHLSLLGNRVPRDPPIQKTIAQLDQILKDSIEKSRNLSHELSPAVLYQGDLGETFEWLARQLKTKHGLTVHVESRDHVDPRSEALKVLLYKTAREILFNVVKHAHVKEARLRIQRLNGSVWLTISDQGRGFDARSLGKTGGFGLLSIRERIELLGGRMKIRSAPSRGSTFLIVLPDDDRQPQEEVEEVGREEGEKRRAPHLLTVSSSPLPSNCRLRVLLVDDHKVMREGLATLLNEQSDLEVVGHASNGREAVDLACKLGPDVVVIDVAMPLMAGDEATRQIRLHLPGVRVVALSMFEEANMAEAMRAAGAEAYLLKTAPSDELLAAIRGTTVPRV